VHLELNHAQVPIVKYFTKMGNMLRIADLVDAPAAHIYIYRTGLVVYDLLGVLPRLPTERVDACTVEDQKWVALTEGSAKVQ
jgi:hypothetical protein